MREEKTGWRFWLATVLFQIVLGALLHFTYAWSGQNWFVGLFSAVNESVWEHMKLIFTPSLIIMLVGSWCFWKKGLRKNLIFAQGIALLVGILFLIAFFYTYTGAFGIREILALDILSFVLSTFLIQGITVKLVNEERLDQPWIRCVGVLLWIVLAAAIFRWTFQAPNVPLFISE